MTTEVEIKAEYIKSHDKLEEQYYKYNLITKEEFDLLHGQNWNDMEAELLAGGYIKPPEPVMDYESEILKLKAEVETLKVKG